MATTREITAYAARIFPQWSSLIASATFTEETTIEDQQELGLRVFTSKLVKGTTRTAMIECNGATITDTEWASTYGYKGTSLSDDQRLNIAAVQRFEKNGRSIRVFLRWHPGNQYIVKIVIKENRS